ncbi:MAG: hypothetical protein IJ106_16390 [Parasporobacterium sp.]|nr:hypothetical protein [Parasporobacterium sp.]MBQ9033006.1 hypothetical protein [Parasporobacterium sp.]
MAQDTLNRIREAELKAKQLVKDAQTSGAEMIAGAREEARNYKEDLIGRSRAAAKQELEQAEAGLDKALADAETRAQAVISQFSQKLETKKEEAVQTVIDHII